MFTKHLVVRAIDVLVLAGLLLAGSASAAQNLKLGDMAPDVFGRPPLGEKVHLTDYRGRIVVISFFASWCPPCRQELPMLARLQQAATRDKVVVISVNWHEDRDHFAQIRSALRKTDLTLVSDMHGDMGKAYDVTAIPHMVIVGKDGRIAAIHIGYGDEEIPSIVNEINTLWRQGGSPSAQDPATDSAAR
jgi:thiol-disulfide isomerase/thioredoxin